MSKAITLELNAERASLLASILKAFILLNPHKPGLMMKEAEALLVEMGEFPPAEPASHAERTEVVNGKLPVSELVDIHNDMYTDAMGNNFSDADPGL